MRKKNVKRTVVVMVLAFVLSLFSGCGRDKGKQEDGGETGGADKTYKIQIMAWQGTPFGKITENAKQYLEEKFNVELEMLAQSDNDYNSKLTVLLSSNTAPDIFFNMNGVTLQELHHQGVLAVIDQELLAEAMPNYKKMVDENAPKAWNRYQVDGDLVAVPNFQMAPYYGLGNSWRADLFKEAGIAELPDTIEECDEAFAKFKEKFPDKYLIGGDKSYKMQFADFVFGAYGMIPYDLTIRDGKIAFSSVQPEIKNALAKLNEWYEKGYIDPECFTDDSTAKDAKYINGTVAIMTGRGWQAYNPDNEGTFFAKTIAQNPGAELVVNHQITGPDGSCGNASYMAVVGEMDANVGVSFGKQVEKDKGKMERILKMLEALAMDEETWLYVNNGVKGEDYEIAEDGSLTRIGEDTEMKKAGCEFFGAFLTPSLEVQYKYFNKNLKKLLDDNFAGKKFYNNIGRQLVMKPEAYVTYSSELSKIEEEYITSVIIGKDSVENWDAYVEKWNKAGGEESVKELNEMYQVEPDGIHITMK